MRASPFIRHPICSRQALGLALVAGAFAMPLSTACADVLDKVVQRNKLTVGLHYVAPEYKAGAKFRTPESIDADLAGDLAKRLGVTLETAIMTPQAVAKAGSAAGRPGIDVALVAVRNSTRCSVLPSSSRSATRPGRWR